MTVEQIEILNKKVWLDMKDLIAYTGISKKTLEKYRDHGTDAGAKGRLFLPASKIGRRYLYNRTKVDKFILDHTQ